MATAGVREQMIEQQVRVWDVLDERVLEALRAVPRELFVPDAHRYLAYADAEVPLAHGQHMLRPSVVGRLLQALAPRAGQRVLEIGTGSGFVSACLRAMGPCVRSLELYAELAESALGNLAQLGMGDVEVLEADAMLAVEGARYDAIAVTGSLPAYDPRFERMLAPGGRLFIVVGEPPAMEALLIERTAEHACTTRSLFETVIDPLVHATRPTHFRF